MNKKIILISCIVLIGLLFSFTNAYVCIDKNIDNKNVQIFKNNINILSLKNDINNGLTKEAIELKLKYFNPCNN